MSPFSHGESLDWHEPTSGPDGGALRRLAGEVEPFETSIRWRGADTLAAAGRMLLIAVSALAMFALTESTVLLVATLALVWRGPDEHAGGALASVPTERASLFPSPTTTATCHMCRTAIFSIPWMLLIAVWRILAVSGVGRALHRSSAVLPLSYIHVGCELSSEPPSCTSAFTTNCRHGRSLPTFLEIRTVTVVCDNYSLGDPQGYACALGRRSRPRHYALALGRAPSPPSSSPLLFISHTNHCTGTLVRAMMRQMISAECSPGSVQNRVRGTGA